MFDIAQWKFYDDETFKNRIDVVNQNLAQLRKGLKNMHDIKEQLKLCNNEMRTFLEGTMSREMIIRGSLNNEDAQGKGYFATRKKFLDRRGRLIRCFLFDEK